MIDNENIIYTKTEKSQRKIKAFANGKKDDAMNYGWKLAQKNPKNEYFIITQDKKCLRFNLQIIA